MSDLNQPSRIALLPGFLINQIAAGEVIERPASVVKELMENSIDAGADRVEINIEAGGTRSIIVHDNGSGIHPDDMELAVLRHSTSKLRTQADLEVINSLGFRGEALSSIASVSDFVITSRIAAVEHGLRLRVDPQTGRNELVPAPRQTGTTVEVNNLFHDIPARRKFLRSERTEFLHILEMVRRLVLSRFDIGIILRHNGKVMLSCPAVESDYRHRIQAVMGAGFYNNARRIDTGIDDQRLWGWLGGTSEARSQSDRQYLYLNRRAVRDRQLSHAVRLALGDIIPVSRHPSYVLHLQADPAAVDFNVHPTKQEVRFRQPRKVHDFVHAVIKEAISRDNTGSAGMAGRQTSIRMPGAYTSPGRVPSLHEAGVSYSSARVREPDAGGDNDVLGIPFAVLDGRYVVSLCGDDLKVIDFRNLKRRYLQQRLSQDLSGDGIRARPLLVPVTLKVNEPDVGLLETRAAMLARLGLEIRPAGPRSVMIRSFPALLPDLDLRALLDGIIGGIRSTASSPDNFQQTVLELLAEHGSVPDARAYTLKEITQELRLFAQAPLPVHDRDSPGLWRTLSPADLRSLIDRRHGK
jgi:DNA mismatch repair protein MutL